MITTIGRGRGAFAAALPTALRAGRAGSAILAVLAGLVLLTGCAGLEAIGGTPSAPPAAAEALERSVPAEISIPRIEARSSLVELGLNADDTVQVPPVSQPMQAGWYALGPAPGEDGPAVILGHVDGNRKPGIFHRLRELQPGDEILVRRADGRTTVFTVSRTQQVPKSEFPTEEVYGVSDGPELRVITCGGSFDAARHSYRDNIIVYAALTGVRDNNA